MIDCDRRQAWQSPLRGLVFLCFWGYIAFGGYIAAPLCAAEDAPAWPSPQPNILWITCEDISPNLGCYGDQYARTPHLDRLAKQSVRYDNAFAPIGVCAPSRSSLITGMYACSLGTQHMRCQGELPPGVKCFPEYLREAGYYCTNNAKTDYNFSPPKSAWDESSKTAHWRKRSAGQPFFAVFNLESSHESQIRLPAKELSERYKDFATDQRHNPADAPLPPYHPDTAEVRRDWANYADAITYMDRQVGNLLEELRADGLLDDTIVLFFSDHGAGMPRSKRWLYDSSTKVPLLVRFPAKYRDLAPGEPGSANDRLVSFVDFAPSMLSLAGSELPAHLQGQPFLGPKATAAREFVHGFRDRMDDRYDVIRSVRDRRFKYIRNFHPELPYFRSQHLEYALAVPTLQVWEQLAAEGKLSGAQAIFMADRKPIEELYDTQADPWEINNLAADPRHKKTLARMRGELTRWMTEIHDLGLLPEADLRTRFGKQSPFDAVRANPEKYPQDRILRAATLANERLPNHLPALVALLQDADPAARYWGALGIGCLGWAAIPTGKAPLITALDDPAPIVRAAAAEALCRLGDDDAAIPVLVAAMRDDNEWVRLYAANALDRLQTSNKLAGEALQHGLRDTNPYVVRVCKHAVNQANATKE